MTAPPVESAVGLSLWLVPSGDARRLLADLVATLAGRYAGPIFEPHVTLLGGAKQPRAEVVATAAKLAAATPRLALRVAGLDGRDEYFRCLYLRIEESRALLEAHRRARALFDRESDPPFLPHLSLVYGRLSGLERERLAATLSGFPAIFEVRELDVHATEGPPAAWRRLAGFELGSGPRPRGSGSRAAR